MQQMSQTTRRSLQTILLIIFAAPLHLALGQSTPPPTLNEILLRLENNLNHYYKDVPNFFCHEHVVSSMTYAKKHPTTVTDSVFRVVRSPSETLTESHEIQAINGTPARGEQVGGPAIVSGVFTGSLDTVSLSQTACMSYTLQPIDPEHPNQPYVIQFTTLPTTQPRPECALKEEGSGRVFVDPTTMQVTRLELRAPNHVISSAERGIWQVSIDYAPVSFVGKTFWMPATVTSSAFPNDAYSPVVYSFFARYSDYHKLEVTSHIVPVQ
jgi:hypothetical protein